jgi:aspartokinase/homoserine dehydrogenase 1
LKDLLVMKFGGTSVGSAERIKVACDLIAKEGTWRPVMAVVSAMSKITDLLLDTTRHAEAGDQLGIDRGLTTLESRHLDAVAQLVGPEDRARVEQAVRELVGDFRRIVSGMQMLVPPATCGG